MTAETNNTYNTVHITSQMFMFQMLTFYDILVIKILQIDVYLPILNKFCIIQIRQNRLLLKCGK
jgi:hypothetical protein